VGGATLQLANPKKTELNFRNSLLMLTKNLPKNRLLAVISVRLVLDGIAAVQFLLQGKSKHIGSILKAHLSFYGLFYRHFKKREEYQSEKYYKTKSIVYIYFINKIKIFSVIFDTTK
jgi:hypothetical protein